jgi:hypothetical protein
MLYLVPAAWLKSVVIGLFKNRPNAFSASFPSTPCMNLPKLSQSLVLEGKGLGSTISIASHT